MAQNELFALTTNMAQLIKNRRVIGTIQPNANSNSFLRNELQFAVQAEGHFKSTAM